MEATGTLIWLIEMLSKNILELLNHIEGENEYIAFLTCKENKTIAVALISILVKEEL